MKQSILSGLAVMVLVSGLSVSLSSSAEETASSLKAEEQQLTETPTQSEETTELAAETQTPTHTVKVGEYQSDSRSHDRTNAIATILAHEWNSRQAATLYVRNIPVLTFVEETSSTPSASEPENLVNSGTLLESLQGRKQPSLDTQAQQKSDPVTRATEVAAKLNQFNRYQIDANNIGVRWNEEEQNYTIEVEGQALVVIGNDTILPDTTQNIAEDALQATNRLRRQMGFAPPLKNIEGKPARENNTIENAFNPHRVINAINGIASWYGPGFHGRLTANGERFNQNELTAAHPSLPFGTTVRVTNKNNGRSVIVRINDRGPFTGGRIIDLSAAAAQVIGMVSSGVAPVQVEVIAAQ